MIEGVKNDGIQMFCRQRFEVGIEKQTNCHDGKIAEDFLKAKRFPEGTFAILTERSTWQKNFSLFRYFGLLSMLEVLPLGLVGRFRRQDALKGRSAVKHQEFILNPASTTEELSALLNKFIAAPPVSFSYPKGAAKA